MTEFRHGFGRGVDWRAALDDCLDQLAPGGSLGFLYVTDLVSDHLEEILARLRAATGVAHWVGAVGIGVCATGHECMDEPAVAVMTADLDPGSFRIFGAVERADAIEGLALDVSGSPATIAIVHADPRTADVDELITALAGKVESGFLIGGLTSSRRRSLQIADAIAETGLSGVAFADSVAVATRLTQGCAPIGRKHLITSAQRNVVVTLDGRPALEVLKEDMGELSDQALNRIGGTVFAGLPIARSDTGDYVVRHLVGIDPGNQLVAVGDIVRTGGELIFCRRDRDTAREDMARMLESIKQGLYGRPRGGLYYSCLGRGPGLFGKQAGELEMIQEALGDFPLVGFFCNGEISHNRLYGYTGVLTLFV